jgi:hypothetical protein
MTIELQKHVNGRLIVPFGHFGESDDQTLVTVIEDFIDVEDLAMSYEYAKVADMSYEGGSHGALKDRVHTFDKFEVANPSLFNLFKENYFVEIKNLLEEKYGLELTGSYCTELHKPLSGSREDRLEHLILSSTCGCKSEINTFITAWTEGTSQKEHTDNSNEFTAIIYLNDDYEGGELNFPDLELSIKPIKGSVILWPGSITHSISTVVSGIRYTMPVFFKAISVLPE